MVRSAECGWCCKGCFSCIRKTDSVATGGLCLSIQPYLWCSHIPQSRWLKITSSSTLQGTIFILQPPFLSSSASLPPISTTLLWSFLPCHQLSESCTITKGLNPHHE